MKFSYLFRNYDPNLEFKIKDILYKKYGYETPRLGLDGIYKYFKSLIKSFRDNGVFVFIVGGTNGKGEVCLTLSKIFNNLNISSAVWTSPHILSVRERFIYNGNYLSYDELFEFFKKDAPYMSYYEYLFYTFCSLMAKREPQVLILEVGLGGRLDAVNLFDANCTCTTSISRDHVHILGNRLDKILMEKLGITRPNIPHISAISSYYLRDLANKYCQKQSSPFYDLQDMGMFVEDESFRLRNYKTAYALYNIFCGDNIDVELVKRPIDIIPRGYNFDIKGRFESIEYKGGRFSFIGSHNLDGFRHLVSRVKEEQILLLSFSNRPLNELREILKLSIKCLNVSKIKLSWFEHFKACEKEDLIKLSQEFLTNVEFVENWQKYIVQSIYKKNNILVAGSYYFLGEVQNFLYRYINSDNSTYSISTRI